MITRMEHVHYLHSQHYHYTTTRLSKRCGDTQFQIFATIDHVLQHVIDRVLVHAGAFRDDLSHLTTYTPDETCCALTLTMPRVVRENPMQIAIVNGGPFEVVSLSFASIVFA